MALSTGLPPGALGKLPADAADMLIHRGEWSWCAMEHSRIGAIELRETGAPFHHIALPLERRPLRFTFAMAGRRQHGRSAPDTVAMIEAGSEGTSHWDDVLESACLYFTDAALARALGIEDQRVDHAVRTQLDHHSPALSRLVHALHADASAGQPHGALIGDAIFMALAAHLVPSRAIKARHGTCRDEPWRVRNALAFIHAHLSDDLTLARIADAAATSPFYLNHAFRHAIGCSIWQYVLRARARYAALMMRDDQAALVTIALAAGFTTYAGFISAFRREFGMTPARVRHAVSR